MSLPSPAVHAEPAPVPLDVPVIVFAFDRPDYLEQVLVSLRRQRGVALDERRVFLLQDDAVSPRSGVRYAEDAAIAASVATFREHFPRGHVAQARGNLGVARNIRRGEVLAFEALDADLAYFFEDDLVLGPEYLRIMNDLAALARADPRVGYFAAYGYHMTPSPGPEAWLIPLAHHWGFGLMREPWRRLREWIEPYDAILERTDYAARDNLAIYRWFATGEVAINFSSQDAAKSVGCAALGIARVMTDVCFGRYIGRRGVHMSPEAYETMGFEAMRHVEGAEYWLADGVASQVSNIISTRRADYEKHRRVRFDPFLAEFERTHFDETGPATEEEVAWLFRLLLGRAPDDGAREALVGKESVRAVRAALLAGREFRGRNAGG